MNPHIPDKKLRLLDSATKLFAERGFHEVKLDQIAEKAGVAKGTVYTYFKSKDSLFCNCIFHEAVEFNNDAINIIDSQKPFEDKLRALIDIQSRFYQEKGALVKQLMQLGPQLKVGETEYNQGIDQLKAGVSIMARFFKQGICEGTFVSDLSPTQMAIVFIQVLDVNALSELFGEAQLREENVFRAMVKLFHRDPSSVIKV